MLYPAELRAHSRTGRTSLRLGRGRDNEVFAFDCELFNTGGIGQRWPAAQSCFLTAFLGAFSGAFLAAFSTAFLAGGCSAALFMARE
jgi:hypothetical protein